MHRASLIAVLAVVLSGRTVQAAPIPLAKDPADLAHLQTQNAASDRLFAADLMAKEEGVLVGNLTTEPLPRGRYRLHVPMALTPISHPTLSDLTVTVSVGDMTRRISTVDFPTPDRFVTVTVDFTTTGTGPVPVRATWSIGPLARQHRLKTMTKPSAPAADLPLRPPDPALELEEPGEHGAVTSERLETIAFRLVARPGVLESLPPLAVVAVRPDKVLYAPGETGTLEVRVRNHGGAESSGQLTVSLVRNLGEEEILLEKPVTVPAGQEMTEAVPFRATGRWGVTALAVLSQGDSRDAAYDYFSVSEDFTEVAIGSTWGSDLHTGLGKHREVPVKMRDIYSNWLELFFWAPCDWSKLVSPLPVWWSGQADYPENEANTKELIGLAHAQGMKVAFYASCNPAGPFAWETARRHPEWFHRNPSGGFSGEYTVEHLDRWNDPEWRNVTGAHMGDTAWYRVPVDLRQPAALDYGIDQIIESARHYGWDAVRFDGHYTISGQDELSTDNMRRLKERVWRQRPAFRFGFNYGRAPEWRTGITHEMREAMAGGGIYLQEGIRNWLYTARKYESWSHYATNELRIAKLVQALGGTYHCIWSLSQTPPEQAMYKLVYGLIAGGHPFYDYASAPGCPSWGAFMTRWSAFLWDRDLRPVADPREMLTISADQPLFWEPLVQERVDADGRRYLIVHLVNPLSSDEIAETGRPAVVENVTVALRKGLFESVPQAVLVRPEAAPFDTTLSIKQSWRSATVTIPRVTVWAMLIFELPGKGQRTPEPARFTEPPDAQKVAAGRAQSIAAQIVDPNKAEETMSLKPGEQIWETDSGYSGVPGFIESVPDGTGGQAQVKTYRIHTIGHSQRFMGRTWLGPLPPGRYRLGFRVKWIDPSAPADPHAWRVHAYVDIDNHETAIDWLTPNCWEDQGGRFEALIGARTPPDRFRKLPPAGQWDYVPIEFELRAAGFINACLIVDSDRDGEQKFYLDHIKTELLEPYNDAKQAEWHPIDKPGGLRAPSGSAPVQVLVVRGLFWQPYVEGRLEEAESAYQLPDTHAALYEYDTVVLCNFDAGKSSYPSRKVLRDWVEDGGRLVVLGGPETLGQGGMLNTYLEDLLPVKLRGPYEVVRCDPPLVLGVEKSPPAADQPVVFWRHDLQARESARILAWAGDHPMAFAGAFGKGRVFAFAGTPLGEEDSQHQPFWETAWWNDLLRRLLTE